MKKITSLLSLALITLSSTLFAADCPALSGQYTISKSDGADFSSFADAVSALTCGGVSAPVTFLVDPGTYEERVSISSIPGASAFTTVTFLSKTGNNAETILSYTRADATLLLNSTSYVSFENITIDHKQATYGNCVRVDGKANNLHFKGMVFNGADIARTGTNSAAIYFTPNAPKTDISFDDCEINNGSVGIAKGGVNTDMPDTHTSISGTLFFNQYESGLALSNEDAPAITNNVYSTLTSYAGYKAISLDGVTNNIIVSNNIVNAATGNVALAMNNCIAQSSALSQINNNSFSVGGSGQVWGIHLTGTTDNVVLNFNRVKLTLNGKQTNEQAFYRNEAEGNNINMMNDIFYDLNTGGYTIVGNSYKDFF